MKSRRTVSRRRILRQVLDDHQDVLLCLLQRCNDGLKEVPLFFVCFDDTLRSYAPMAALPQFDELIVACDFGKRMLQRSC